MKFRFCVSIPIDVRSFRHSDPISIPIPLALDTHDGAHAAPRSEQQSGARAPLQEGFSVSAVGGDPRPDPTDPIS
eukprot:13046120-Alexandrium_andersonii.AAC.1